MNKKVSVFIVTYNQEKYIGQCLDSIVNQKVDFDYEIVVGEDCSTDNTLRICKEYALQYSQIKLLSSEKNIGFIKNWERVLKACEGEYIAMCEGDDYWCESNKLQQQVNFLDQNPEYSICGGVINHFFEDRGVLEKLPIPNEENYQDGREVTLDNYMQPYILRTATICFRRNALKDIHKFNKIKDVILFGAVLEHGKGFVFNQIFSVYRKHSSGEWTKLDSDQKILYDLDSFQELDKHYHLRSRSVREFYLKRNFDLFFNNYNLYKEKKIKRLTLFDLIRLLNFDIQTKGVNNKRIIYNYLRVLYRRCFNKQ